MVISNGQLNKKPVSPATIERVIFVIDSSEYPCFSSFRMSLAIERIPASRLCADVAKNRFLPFCRASDSSFRCVTSSGFDDVVIAPMFPSHLDCCSEHVLEVGLFEPDRKS